MDQREVADPCFVATVRNTENFDRMKEKPWATEQ